MNIDWVIPCRFVEVHDNLGTLVGAGIDTYWVPQFPTPIAVPLAVRVTAMADELEAGPEWDVRNIVRGPDDQVVGQGEGKVAVGGSAAEHHDWLQGVMLPMAIMIQPMQEGTYSIELQIEQSSANVPIHVVLGPPPGMPPPP